MELKSKRIKLGNGIFLNLIETSKFKSNLLSYYIIRPLDRNEVTYNALLPMVLKRGSKDYPTNLDIERKLEDMYGASLSVGVNKRGEKQVIRYSMQWVQGDYFGDESYDYQVMDLLRKMIYEPNLENHSFKEDYVRQEKENLKSIIDSKINDKRSYAIDRCIEEMCKDEKYSIYQLGYTEDLEDINEENLYKHHMMILETSPIEIFYAGNLDDDLIDFLKNSNSIERKDLIEIPKDEIVSSIEKKSIIKEELDVNQGKLVMGYRSGITYKDSLYNALLLASDILGGGPNSKLFKNVREKESLAYYISCSVLKYKSILLVDGGIEFGDFDKTLDIITKQLEDLKGGKFTQDDIDISIKSIQSSIESIKDSVFRISEFFFSQLLSEDKRSLEEVLSGFENISKEEIIQAANGIIIDTIYFMKNKSS